MSVLEAPPAAPRVTAGRAVGTSAREGRPGAVLACRVRRAEARGPTLQDVAFEVRAGEAYGLLGPAGAGKTTIVRLVCGIATPVDGEVLVLGRPVGLLAPAVRHAAVGYALQHAAAMPGLSVADTLRFWARLSAAPPPELAARVAEALALTGLEERAGVVAERCPIGVQRRLGLAVALLHRPRLVVADDPLAGLDADGTEAVLSALARLRDAGTAVLCTSTRGAELARLCDRVGRLDRGRLRPG